MNWDTIQQFVRIALGWLGTYLTTAGILDQSNAQMLVGGLLMLTQVAWWWFWNKRRVE